MVIVLSIVALLSVMVIAFLGSATKEMDISQKSTTTVQSVELAAQAASQVVGDLLKEIRAGSVETSPNGDRLKTVKILYPATPVGMVPDRSGVGGALPPNLVKQSAYGKAFYDENRQFGDFSVYPEAKSNKPSNRASNVSTDSLGASFAANAASAQVIAPARWNLPGLLPRANATSVNDMTPMPAGNARLDGGIVPWEWKAPSWVYLQKDGQNPTSFMAVSSTDPAKQILGRYAYQMYDVGGLLDLNVAGYDSDAKVVGDEVASRKGGAAFADLTQIGLTQAQLKKLVAYRNPGALGDSAAASLAGQGPKKLPHGNPYANFVLSGQNSMGFLRVGSSGTAPLNRVFASRLAMIGAVQKLAESDGERPKILDTLQYLTHFSRSLEQPSFKPGFLQITKTSDATTTAQVRPSIVPPVGKVDDKLNARPVAGLASDDIRVFLKLPYEMAGGNNRGGNDAWGTFKERGLSTTDTRTLQEVVNPGFLEVRVKTAFTRLDGTKAVEGEPLVKKRFALERLAWITAKGPSATLDKGDSRYNKDGTVDNIYRVFGLKWDGDTSDSQSSGGYFWRYDHGKTGEVLTLEELAAGTAASGLPREPDFFELLRAGINVGSVGKSAVAYHRQGESWDAATYQHMRDRNSTFQIMEIGANLIDQYDLDSFPTIIKLPSPDPSLPTVKARYNPALFTARGVEDLPYFYRFHWRGVQDGSDRPKPNIDGIKEITNILSYAGSGYNCGTTFLMGFPELWNPHAPSSSASFDASSVPEGFRIVAASETPSDALYHSKLSDVNNHQGLATIPKMGDVATNPKSKSNWLYLNNVHPPNPNVRSPVSDGLWSFYIRPTGFFSFSKVPSTNETFTWLPRKEIANEVVSAANVRGKQGQGVFSYNSFNQTWRWPLELLPNDVFNDFTNLGGLFWNRMIVDGKRGADPNNPAFGLYRGTITYPTFMALAPVWKLPDSGEFSGPPETQAFPLTGPSTYQYQGAGSNNLLNWPYITPSVSSLQYWAKNDSRSKAERNGPVATRVMLPSDPRIPGNNPPAAPFTISTTQIYSSPVDNSVWVLDPGSTALREVEYPATPKLDLLHLAQSYSAGAAKGGLNYLDGKPLENPFPVNKVYSFALTDNSLKRAIIATDPATELGSAPVSGKVYPTDNGTNQFNRVVDIRGTELLFNVTNSKLFREPTALCQPGFPAGSGFSAGEGNFFSSPDYNGSISDGIKRWTGISLGEIPSSYVAVTKLYQRQSFVEYKNYTYPFQGMGWFNNDNEPAIDVKQDNFGLVGGTLGTEKKFRFFHVPMNVAGIDDARFTVRLQFKDPVMKQWVTYDERFIDVDAASDGAGGRYGAAPIIGKSEVQVVMSGTATQTGAGDVSWVTAGGASRPIGWSFPVVTSYDPRSARFGQPMRYGYSDSRTIRSTDRHLALLLNPVGNKPPDSSAEQTGLFPEGGNLTDRPLNVAVDLPGAGTPGTLNPRWGAPGLWHSWTYWGSGNSYDFFPDSYLVRAGLRPPNLYFGAEWWLIPKGADGKSLCQLPSLNAYDYGWYPRLLSLSAASGATPPSSYRAGLPKILPNFIQDSYSNNYADSLHIGDFSENIAPGEATKTDPIKPYRQAYADPDDVVRRASGGLAASGGYTNSIEGLPMGQGSGSISTDKVGNRPVILNRPFRSVAEMGYTFRGSPWKNISFFLPETGDAALLDLFCIAEPPPISNPGGPAEPPLVAGKVNLNTRQELVLRALLAGGLKDEYTSTQRLSGGATGEAAKAALKLLDRTTHAGAKPWLGPLTNVSELAGKLFSKGDVPNVDAEKDPVYTSIAYESKSTVNRNPDIPTGTSQLKWNFTGFSADLEGVFGTTRDTKTQRFRESALRALVDGGQTRVWNLMLDLIVQSGKLVPNARDLKDFVRLGEQRAWVFLAIDRLTGDVLDQQVEWVQ